MGVDKTNTSNLTFMQRVGRWWNKNGNTTGKIFQAAGTTAMGVGMTGMFIDAMNKPSSSIFGCGYSPYSMGMMNGCGMFGGCCSPYSMSNPMMSSMMNPMMMNPMMGMSGSIFG